MALEAKATTIIALQCVVGCESGFDFEELVMR